MTKLSTPVVLAAIFTLAAFAPAQAAWTDLSAGLALSPSTRAGTQGITDGVNMLIFGGKPGPGIEYNDLWRFDGSAWSDITPTSGPLPPERDFYAAAWDTARGVYVLFGGRSSALSSNLGDTWEYDGTTWTQKAPAVSPSARRWPAMAYDIATGKCILFGGHDGAYNDETWSWDGAVWTQLTPTTTSPSPRGRGRLSYDLTRGEMLYYGGRDAAALSDTWIWDGSDWSSVATATSPGSVSTTGTVTPGLFAYGMTYDLLRDRHVIFGGTRTGATLSYTWEFDGTDWLLRTSSGPTTAGPGNRTGAALAFVIGLGKSYLFAGFQGPQYDDTWEYQTSPLASAAAYGGGCTGSGGMLNLAADNAPWTGDTFTTTISGLAAGSLVFNVVGLSNTNWAGGGLPTALGLIHPAGGAGCNLLASTDAVSLLIASGGTAATSLTLPNNPAFASIMLYQQALEIELSATLNITSINSSNGLALTVGAR